MLIDNLRTVKSCTYPEDIAEKLLELSNLGRDADTDAAILDDLTAALYQLRTIAGNEHNFDYWRTFYNVLAVVCCL